MTKKQQPPSWLELVQRLERAVGEPVEGLVRSDAYFDVMTHVNRARARFTRSFEEVAEQWLHLWNVPAASDVRRLREQLGRLERQVERMANDLADQAEGSREPAAPPKPKRPPKAKPKPEPPAPT